MRFLLLPAIVLGVGCTPGAPSKSPDMQAVEKNLRTLSDLTVGIGEKQIIYDAKINSHERRLKELEDRLKPGSSPPKTSDPSSAGTRGSWEEADREYQSIVEADNKREKLRDWYDGREEDAHRKREHLNEGLPSSRQKDSPFRRSSSPDPIRKPDPICSPPPEYRTYKGVRYEKRYTKSRKEWEDMRDMVMKLYNWRILEESLPGDKVAVWAPCSP